MPATSQYCSQPDGCSRCQLLPADLVRQNAAPQDRTGAGFRAPNCVALLPTEHGASCLHSGAHDGQPSSSILSALLLQSWCETERQLAVPSSPQKLCCLQGSRVLLANMSAAQPSPMCWAQSHELPADMVRAALKEPARTKARTREVVFFRQAMWKDGKPEKQGEQATVWHMHDSGW